MKKVHEYLSTILAITHDEEHARHVANLSPYLKVLGYLNGMLNLPLSPAICMILVMWSTGMNMGDGIDRLSSVMRRECTREIAVVIAAIGNHEERSGVAVTMAFCSYSGG